MTANPPPVPPISKFEPNPKVRAQVAELRELERQFPAPTWDDVRADWEWLYAHFGTSELAPHPDRLVAVYEQRIVGSDPGDELALRIRLARQYRVHPERFVVSFNG